MQMDQNKDLRPYIKATIITLPNGNIAWLLI